jgi:hypothetical protein
MNDLGDEWVINTKLSGYPKGKSPCWLNLELAFVNDNKLVSVLLCLDSRSLWMALVSFSKSRSGVSTIWVSWFYWLG